MVFLHVLRAQEHVWSHARARAWPCAWPRVMRKARSSSLRELQLNRKAYIKRAWLLQRFCNFCLITPKNLWICLISTKNLYPKHRFFALFRQPFRDVTFESEVSFMSTLMEPDFLDMSEWFAGKAHHVWAICRFFSPSLSCFTQTWWTFQADYT